MHYTSTMHVTKKEWALIMIVRNLEKAGFSFKEAVIRTVKLLEGEINGR